jgi:hypothetical protein
MADDPRTQTPEQTLAWEAERRRTAGFSALGAALLTIAGSVISGFGRAGVPDYDDRALSVLDTLRRAASGQDQVPGRFAAQTVYLGDHVVVPSLGALLFGIGTLLLFPPMGYLFRATRARRPALGQIALILLAVGVVAVGVGRTAVDLGQYVAAAGFDGGTNSEARDALNGPVVSTGFVLWTAGGLALGFSFVLICLNAMRVGLLSRFMGILGVIVGATFVLPLDQQGIIRVFWIGALGALLLGRWPSGIPRAWTEGVAAPWPSQQEIREQREAARREAAGEPEEPEEPEDADVDAPDDPRLPPRARRPEPVAAEAHPSSKKRKRKRRT